MMNYFLKFKIVFLLLLAFHNQLFCQTMVSGVISANTLWTKLNSPYLVTANTVVMPNVTLDLEPGVVVKFANNVQLMLRGSLRGYGTSVDSITFAADNGVAQWNGVFVDNASYNPKVSLRFFSGSKALSLFKVGSVGSNDTLMKFTRCRFNANNSVFEEYDGIKTHMVYVDSCLFTNTAYYCNIGASNNIIKNSTFQGSYRAFYNSTSQATVIDHCEFSGFTDAAVLVNGTVTNCKLYNNGKAICTMDVSSPIITGNSIHDNTIGIEAWNFGTINSSTQINYNEFCNNTYAIKKVYSADMNAPDNCWCTTNTSQIDAVIYDFFDAPNLGIVFYSPIAPTCPNTLTGLHSSTGLVQGINVFPNPVTNKLGMDVRSLKETDVTIKLTDALGKEVLHLFRGTIQEERLNFDLGELPPGIYFIEISHRTEKLTLKIARI